MLEEIKTNEARVKSLFSGKNQGTYKVGYKKPPKEFQWKPGESGNDKGKEIGTVSLTAAIKRRLKELSPDQKRTALDWLADNIIQDALEHNNAMRKLIWNYVDGLPQFNADFTSGGEPLGIIFLPRRKQDENKQLDEPNEPKLELGMVVEGVTEKGESFVGGIIREIDLSSGTCKVSHGGYKKLCLISKVKAQN